MPKFTALIPAAALAIAATASIAEARPPAGYQSQWYTTANGCSYSRTHAPGYGVTWVLIQNPHHINKPNVHSGCRNML